MSKLAVTTSETLCFENNTFCLYLCFVSEDELKEVKKFSASFFTPAIASTWLRLCFIIPV